MPIIKYKDNQKLRKDRTPRDSNLAGGVFSYDRFKGSDGSGPGNTIFASSRRFTADDGSLSVFKNGQYQYQSHPTIAGQYEVLDQQTIRFLVTINPADDIVLLVNGGSIVRDNSVNNFNNITQLFGDLYFDGTSVMFNTGNKFFASNYNIESLTNWVTATVGVRGTHISLQQAITDVPAGSLILVNSEDFTLSSGVTVNKDNITIMGCGRGSRLIGDGSFPALTISNPGCKVMGLKFDTFSTAIDVNTEFCIITENYFSNNTTDVDYLGVTKIVIENNITEA